jgi:hypothetical protein
MKQYNKPRKHTPRYEKSQYQSRPYKKSKQTQINMSNIFLELVFRENDLSLKYDLPYYHDNTEMNMEEYLYRGSRCDYNYSRSNCIFVDFPNLPYIKCYGSINVFIPKTCTNLKELCCNGCPNIIIEEGVNLERLECHGCPNIFIPNSCTNLKDLDCSGCTNIIIPQYCVNLESIECYGCPNLVIPKTCVNLKNIHYTDQFDPLWINLINLRTYTPYDWYIYSDCGREDRKISDEEINITIPPECINIEWIPTKKTTKKNAHRKKKNVHRTSFRSYSII